MKIFAMTTSSMPIESTALMNPITFYLETFSSLITTNPFQCNDDQAAAAFIQRCNNVI